MFLNRVALLKIFAAYMVCMVVGPLCADSVMGSCGDYVRTRYDRHRLHAGSGSSSIWGMLEHDPSEHSEGPGCRSHDRPEVSTVVPFRVWEKQPICCVTWKSIGTEVLPKVYPDHLVDFMAMELVSRFFRPPRIS